MTTEDYLKTRLVDNDLAEPFLKCLEHQRKLELQVSEARKWLVKHGVHPSSCSLTHDDPCDCGLSKLRDVAE